MANRDAPFGLRPNFHLTGGVIRPQQYHIADQLANNIFYGDPVERVEAFSGRESRDIDASDAPGSEVPWVGVFAGCTYTKTTGEVVFSRYWPSGEATLGSKGATAYVYDDPFIVFEVQDDGTDGTKAETNVGQLADAVYTEGSTATGMSKVELDLSDVATGANLYIYDYKRDVENDPTLANCVWLVLINEHAYRNAGASSFDVLASS